MLPDTETVARGKGQILARIDTIEVKMMQTIKRRRTVRVVSVNLLYALVNTPVSDIAVYQSWLTRLKDTETSSVD